MSKIIVRNKELAEYLKLNGYRGKLISKGTVFDHNAEIIEEINSWYAIFYLYKLKTTTNDETRPNSTTLKIIGDTKIERKV